MSEKKKLDTKALLERSRKAKSKALQKTLGKQKNNAKFSKVNFNG